MILKTLISNSTFSNFTTHPSQYSLFYYACFVQDLIVLKKKEIQIIIYYCLDAINSGGMLSNEIKWLKSNDSTREVKS